MPELHAQADRFALKQPFRISNHVWNAIEVVTVELREGNVHGRGEGSPIVYYGETADGLVTEVEALRPRVEAGMTRAQLQAEMKAGSARCALDCAFWRLEAQQQGRPVHELAGLVAPAPVASAITVTLDTPEAMRAAAESYHAYPLLKVKLGGADDEACIRAVRAGAPQAKLTIDPNTGWDIKKLKAMERVLLECGVVLIEQPLPPGDDEDLRGYTSAIPLCADESCQTSADVANLVGKYQVGSIKLDKTGGLTEALALKAGLERAGLQLMVSCMVGTSLGMAPARLLAPYCVIVDLDGPMNAAEDREHAIAYVNGMMMDTPTALWG